MVKIAYGAGHNDRTANGKISIYVKGSWQIKNIGGIIYE